MDEKVRKRCVLDEQYIDNKKKIEYQMEVVQEKMSIFRRESEQMIRQFIHCTKNDEINLSKVEQQLKNIEDELFYSANKEIERLEENILELNKEYEQTLLELENQ